MKVQRVRVRKFAFFFSYSAAAEGGFWGCLLACVLEVGLVFSRRWVGSLGRSWEWRGGALLDRASPGKGQTHFLDVGQLDPRLLGLLAGAHIAEARPPPLAIGPAGKLDPALPSRHLVCLCALCEASCFLATLASVDAWRAVVSSFVRGSLRADIIGLECSVPAQHDRLAKIGQQRLDSSVGGWRWFAGRLEWAEVGGESAGRKVGEEIKPGSAKSRSDLG